MRITEPVRKESLVETKGTKLAQLSESEEEIVKRCKRALAKARTAKGWWATEDGRKAQMHFRGWGAVVRERRATGDPTAYPKSDGAGGKGQRSLDSQPQIVMAHDSVAAWIEKLTGPQADLLAWIYVHHTEERPLVVVYEFADGSKSDIVPADAPEPLQYERRHTLASGFIQIAPLSKLRIPAIERAVQLLGGSEMWKEAGPVFLEGIHELLGRRLVEELKL